MRGHRQELLATPLVAEHIQRVLIIGAARKPLSAEHKCACATIAIGSGEKST